MAFTHTTKAKGSKPIIDATIMTMISFNRLFPQGKFTSDPDIVVYEMSSALQRPFGRTQRQVLCHLHTMQHHSHIFSNDLKSSWV